MAIALTDPFVANKTPDSVPTERLLVVVVPITERAVPGVVVPIPTLDPFTVNVGVGL